MGASCRPLGMRTKAVVGVDEQNPVGRTFAVMACLFGYGIRDPFVGVCDDRLHVARVSGRRKVSLLQCLSRSPVFVSSPASWMHDFRYFNRLT